MALVFHQANWIVQSSSLVVEHARYRTMCVCVCVLACVLIGSNSADGLGIPLKSERLYSWQRLDCMVAVLWMHRPPPGVYFNAISRAAQCCRLICVACTHLMLFRTTLAECGGLCAKCVQLWATQSSVNKPSATS